MARIFTRTDLLTALLNWDWLVRNRPNDTEIWPDTEMVGLSESSGGDIAMLTQKGLTPAT